MDSQPSLVVLCTYRLTTHASTFLTGRYVCPEGMDDLYGGLRVETSNAVGGSQEEGEAFLKNLIAVFGEVK